MYDKTFKGNSRNEKAKEYLGITPAENNIRKTTSMV